MIKKSYEEIISTLTKKFKEAGLDTEKAKSIAEILTEGELLGHTTHGLALVQAYLDELAGRTMEKTGSYEVLNKTIVAEAWDGRYLPGTWLTEKAIEKATEMAKEYGTGTITIQKSHHIACLAAFLEKTTRENLTVIVACSDPKNKAVAPFGGTIPMYSPNPLAIGIPTESEPILIDVSMSTTANGVVNKAAKNNVKLGGPWLLDKNGNATDDPQTIFDNPPATVLPLGGMDLGYKGFALGIMIEALTGALGGHGRVSDPSRWGASVFVQVIDSSKFGGEHYFLSEMQYFVENAKKNTPLNPQNPVRLPGENGLKKKQLMLKEGIAIPENLLGFFE